MSLSPSKFLTSELQKLTTKAAAQALRQLPEASLEEQLALLPEITAAMFGRATPPPRSRKPKVKKTEGTQAPNTDDESAPAPKKRAVPSPAPSVADDDAGEPAQKNKKRASKTDDDEIQALLATIPITAKKVKKDEAKVDSDGENEFDFAAKPAAKKVKKDEAKVDSDGENEFDFAAKPAAQKAKKDDSADTDDERPAKPAAKAAMPPKKPKGPPAEDESGDEASAPPKKSKGAEKPTPKWESSDDNADSDDDQD